MWVDVEVPGWFTVTLFTTMSEGEKTVIKAIRCFGSAEAPLFLGEYMESIRECAALYNKLLGKKYIFTLEGNLKITVEFTPSNFYHLLGLEKLTDIDQIKKAKPGKVFKGILNGSMI